MALQEFQKDFVSFEGYIHFNKIRHIRSHKRQQPLNLWLYYGWDLSQSFLTDVVLLSYQVLYCISLQSKQMAKKRHNKRSNQLKKGCGPMEWNISIIIETNNKIVHKIVWMIDSIFESIFSPQYLMGKEC